MADYPTPGDAGRTAPGPPGTDIDVAATVVLLRDGDEGLEVLLLERPRDRGSFAGAWVFPGGRVDPVDRALAGNGEEAAARVAAVREVAEETGLILQPETMVATALWTPPHNVPKRMRTWFFTAAAPDGDVVLMPEESIDYAWMAPDAALRMHGDGTLSLVPPTWVTLHGLQSHRTVAEVLGRLPGAARRDYATRLCDSARGPVLLWVEDVAYDDDALIDADGWRHRLEIGSLPWVYSRSSGIGAG